MIDTLPADGLARVRAWLADYQQRLIDCLEGFEPTETFCDDLWERPEGGGGRTRVLSGGEVFEQVGVGFSDVRGATLPVAATARRPELVGAAWRALGCSVVVHPRNPHVPTSHANVRMIVTTPARGEPIWWFGGGFDLTPFYPIHADVIDWHRRAQVLCKPFAADRYATHKAWCDKYFYLPHRGETRGVGGLFFDDLNADGFERSFEYLQAVGDGYLHAYTALVERRAGDAYGVPERDFQLYRRGRYVEFNLVHDRGTLFGLQSGGRTESILMSLPPAVRFAYGFCPAPGSAEARLADYLQPRDWLAEAESDAGAPVMARP